MDSPPRRDEFAAFTITSTANSVISPLRTLTLSRRAALTGLEEEREGGRRVGWDGDGAGKESSKESALEGQKLSEYRGEKDGSSVYLERV